METQILNRDNRWCWINITVILVIVEDMELCIVSICIQECSSRETRAELIQQGLETDIEVIGNTIRSLIALAPSANLQRSLVRDASDERDIDNNEFAGTEAVEGLQIQ